MPSRSLGVVNRPRFADDGYLDMARVLELVLNPPRDVLRQPDGFLIAHLLALDHDADLASGLQGERFRHALERVGYSFELLEPLDVGLEDVAPRTRAGGRDCVGRLHDHRFERWPVYVHVVGSDRLQHRLRLAMFLEEIEAELEMRALDVP